MKKKQVIFLGFIAASVIVLLGLSFVAGGIVARHDISPFVRTINFADSQVKQLLEVLKGEQDNQTFFTTAYHHIKRSDFPTSSSTRENNVAFIKLNKGFVIAQRAGGLKFAVIHDDGSTSVQQLATMAPTNKEEFLVDAIDFNPRLKFQFGVKDLFVRHFQGALYLYASHQYWYPDKKCAVLRVSLLKTTTDNLLRDTNDANWNTIFETQPCLDLKNKLDQFNVDSTFLQSGGRLALLNNDSLLVTVGEHFQDSIHNKNSVQDPGSSYGKIFRINLENNNATIYSMGLRNPQGLYVDSEGNIWSAEHGPRGGDELNLIEPDNNYGWPYVSYGTSYGGVEWPSHLNWASHEGFTKPRFAWLPSIGVNSVIRVERPGFPRWQGDLIVSSLKDRSIHRLVLDDKRVIIRERIHIGSRIRDLMQSEDGKLILLSDEGILVFLEAVNDDDPQSTSAEFLTSKLWATCASCHSNEQDGQHSVGPNLHGIFGKKIGRFDDYEYSRSIADNDGYWTSENLDKFLLNPGLFAPNTKMQSSGIESAEHRQAIINFLKLN